MTTIATAGELDLTHTHHPVPPESIDTADLADRIDHPHADDDFYCLAY
ncbi:hypothetical protein [Nocardia sp. NBC_01327]|nr:hypothetical protein OG326_27505 [Nocardia sp. NBC_01327]